MVETTRLQQRTRCSFQFRKHKIQIETTFRPRKRKRPNTKVNVENTDTRFSVPIAECWAGRGWRGRSGGPVPPPTKTTHPRASPHSEELSLAACWGPAVVEYSQGSDTFSIIWQEVKWNRKSPPHLWTSVQSTGQKVFILTSHDAPCQTQTDLLPQTRWMLA